MKNSRSTKVLVVLSDPAALGESLKVELVPNREVIESKSAKMKLLRLVDELIEDILAASDEEILATFKLKS